MLEGKLEGKGYMCYQKIISMTIRLKAMFWWDGLSKNRQEEYYLKSNPKLGSAKPIDKLSGEDIEQIYKKETLREQ